MSGRSIKKLEKLWNFAKAQDDCEAYLVSTRREGTNYKMTAEEV